MTQLAIKPIWLKLLTRSLVTLKQHSKQTHMQQQPKEKKVDELIKENEELLRRCFYYESIIAKMPGHVFWKDKNGIFLGCNDQQAKTLGLSSWRQVIGKTTYDMIWHGQPEEARRKQAEIINANDKGIIESRTTQILEEPLVQQDGSKAIYLSNKSPLYNENNEVIGILGYAVDITAQKEIEELKQEQEREIIKQQLEITKALSSTIAHELRTPLATISMAAKGTKRYLPDLLETYKLAIEAKIPVPNIRPSQFELLASTLDSIVDEVNHSNTIINMLLINTEQTNISSDEFQICSIVKCIEEALRRYPFQPDERELIHWNDAINFNFRGKEMLTVHILFNLVKNAIYYIKAAGKGDIHIWLETSKDYNELHFCDTGKGISSETLAKIFDLFFSRTHHGSGIGLAFCKMVMLSYKGKIECKSIQGEFTEFILSFPILETT